MLTKYRFLMGGSNGLLPMWYFVIYSFHKEMTKRKNAERINCSPASSSETVSRFIPNIANVIPSSAITFSRPHLVEILIYVVHL